MRNMIVCLTLALSGCSQVVMTRPGTTQDQYSADRAQCVYQAQLATATVAADNPFIANSQVTDLSVHCMELRGYTVSKN